MSEELEKFLSQRYKDVMVIDFEGRKVPCIVLERKKFDDIINTIAGRPISVETNLNILQDGLGHVFVKVTLHFSHGNIEEQFLIYANENVDFFEELAETSLLALASSVQSNIFMIQLPKPERAQNALEIIRKGLHKKKI